LSKSQCLGMIYLLIFQRIIGIIVII
jgi:hypothetical protein